MTTERADDRRQVPVDPMPSPWTQRDQRSIAVTTFLCLVAMGIWYLTQGGWDRLVRGRFIEQPHEVQLQLDWSTTTWPELTLVHGIGETLARRIIEQRDKDGILTPRNLADVHGIGDAKLAALLQNLTVATGNDLQIKSD